MLGETPAEFTIPPDLCEVPLYCHALCLKAQRLLAGRLTPVAPLGRPSDGAKSAESSLEGPGR
jgi:hypothetical protein